MRLEIVFKVLFSCLVCVASEVSFPRVVYVAQEASGNGDGASWENAFTTISAALLSSGSGDQIWVKSATYPEVIQLKAWVFLYGGFQGTESDLDQRDFARNETILLEPGGCVSCSQYGSVRGAHATRLDGFTVKGSVGSLAASVTLANCIVVGRVFCGYTTSSVVLLNSTVTGGGVGVTGGRAIIITSSITSFGGGIVGALRLLDGASATLVDSTVSHNDTGGIFLRESILSATNCIISNNSGMGVSSVGYYPVSWEDINRGVSNCATVSPRLVNCVVTDNSGWGVYCEGNRPVLINCTIANNAAGGVYSTRSYYAPVRSPAFWDCDCCFPVLTNCILWQPNAVRVDWRYYEEWVDPIEGDSWFELVGVQTLPAGSDGLTVRNSCVAGGWPGAGENIGVDPLFVDAPQGDYHLQAGSPCIDAATATDAPSTDLDGKPRPVDIPGVGHEGPDAFDIGAYEYQGSATPSASLWILFGTGQVTTLPR